MTTIFPVDYSVQFELKNFVNGTGCNKLHGMVRYISALRERVAKLVAYLLATAALWVRIQTFLNTKMVDISNGVANTP
jgi:hypothetical protein